MKNDKSGKEMSGARSAPETLYFGCFLMNSY